MPASEVTESATPSLPAEDFKAIFRGHPGGVSLITADAEDGSVALTATSVAPISVDQPLLVFSISALGDQDAVHAEEIGTYAVKELLSRSNA
ncbi:flavin reductase [Glutamicibacter nicotianae]|uniref:flavin reductase n=1 Tax=Glutamicibacter nicotianae TaxID=37929 RepID=UPI003D7EFE0B